ncbi:MAG: damage-inducible protein DinB [Bacteroidetes bacterium]|nr:damage-inducible protein DinB [Bacteroidota bacterium]
MNKKDIEALYEYDKWADLKMFEAASLLTKEQYLKNLISSFGGIQGTFVHIMSANIIWLSRWTGKEQLPLQAADFPVLEILKKRWDIYQLEMANFINSLNEEKIIAQLSYKDFKGKTHEQPLYLLMQHKVNHSTYHRGQLTVLLKQSGAGVVGTDFITYIREKEMHV